MTTGPVVVGLGDSITLGVGDGVHTAQGDCGWARLTAHALDASAFFNLAANGARARALVDSQVPAALMRQPDVVLVSIGGNDVLRGDFDPAAVEKDLTDAFGRLARPGRRVVVLTLTRIGLFNFFPGHVRRVMGRRIDAANAAIVSAAKATGAELVDGAELFAAVGPQSWHIDRVHPSARGHRALAAAAAQTLTPQFTATGTIPEPAPRPHVGLQVAWLVVYGLPWVVKRSHDLLPQVTAVMARELRDDRRARNRV